MIDQPIASYEKLTSLLGLKNEISDDMKNEIQEKANSYKSSVGHWKNYEIFLADIKDIKLTV